MSQPTYQLVLDLGTTGIKAFIFNEQNQIVHKVYQKISKTLLHENWVEQNPQEILAVSKKVLRQAIRDRQLAVSQIRSLGMTNQRETIVAWDTQTGSPLYPAIVWEDQRTLTECQRLTADVTTSEKVRSITGLTINPYFSATKITWLLNNVPAVQTAASQHRLAVGTVDAWMIWNLLDDHPLVTEVTNASRTMLFNLHTQAWDQELLHLFTIPAEILPKVLPSVGTFGSTHRSVLGASIPLVAVCGDQQSSLFAAAQNQAGITKITYGTGTFVMHSLGTEFKLVPDFFTTMMPTIESPQFALEAKVGAFGQLVEAQLSNPEALETLFDDMAEQVASAVNKLPTAPTEIWVDGGMTQSHYLLTKQQEVLGIQLKLQSTYDATALGTALLMHQYFS